MRIFHWSAEREQALLLSRSGHYTQAEIASQLGVSRRTLEGWARRPAWRARQREMEAVSFAEWARDLRDGLRRHAAAFLDKNPPKYRRPRAPTPQSEAPIRSRPLTRSTEEIRQETYRRLELQACMPPKPWWE